MQHIVHLFIGDELVSFRDRFASIFRSIQSDIDDAFFAAITVTRDNDGTITLNPDKKGDSLDEKTINSEDSTTGLFNYFESLFDRRVTVAHPGNKALVINIWTALYADKYGDIVRQFIDVISSSKSRISIEVSGFTNDAVSCFIPNPDDRQASEVYRQCFDDNISVLRAQRANLAALRLIANKNTQGISLNFNQDVMAQACAEFAVIRCRHYTTIQPPVVDYLETPFESFGLSSIKFDRRYYHDYIRNRILVDRLEQEGVNDRHFNINALAQRSNPIFDDILDEIHKFHKTIAVDNKADLDLAGNATASGVIGRIDGALDKIVQSLRDKIDKQLGSGNITIFEAEALLSLILGEDCAMFTTSAEYANEIVLDDVLDESAEFFLSMDSDEKVLHNVKLETIKQIRTKMRNIAVANRDYKKKLEAIDANKKEVDEARKHIEGNRYQFGGDSYSLDLDIDTEPLEITYMPHEVKTESVDLRGKFGPIRNQGTQGSCSSFAISSVIEAVCPDDKRLSPAFLYWNAREANGKTDADSGASLYDVLKGAADKGICEEEQMPYNAKMFTVRPSDEAFADALGRRVLEAQTVELDMNSIKSALSDGCPVIIAARIFDSFSETRSGFIRQPSKSETEDGDRKDGHGRHAMVVCGFSDKEKILVIRNSWGTDFGDNGYCYMPYSYAKKYLLQACIITKVSSAESGIDSQMPKTLNFNLGDNNIEAAILQNLIDENNFELGTLADKANEQKALWSENIGILGNVNKQAEIKDAAQKKLEEQIGTQKKVVGTLVSDVGEKLRQWRSDKITTCVCAVLMSIILWGCSLFMPFLCIFAGVVSAGTLIYLSTLLYRYKVYRQSLRDEIQENSKEIDRLKAEKDQLAIKVHVNGKVIHGVNDLKVELQSKHNKMKAFDANLIKMYKKAKSQLATMSPAVPYPFLAVLDNDRLDWYYSFWKDKMVTKVDVKSLLNGYSVDDDFDEIIDNNADLNAAIVRGLKGFSMREYISRSDLNKWQFLPDDTNLSEVIPNFDLRGIPFCPYNLSLQGDAKYIFFKDASSDDMSRLKTYFQQVPQPVPIDDPDSMTILSTIRYNI